MGTSRWMLAALAIALAGSCKAILGDDFVVVVETARSGGGGTTGTGGTGVGGAGGTSIGGAGGAGLCNLVGPPPPPTAPDPGPNDVDVVTAIRSLSYDEAHESEAGPNLGYDLDGTCTCLGEESSCAPFVTPAADCDGPRGRDNAMSRVFQAASGLDSTFSSAHHSDQTESGRWSLLVRVMGYNGQANDDAVVVALYPSSGRDEEPCLVDFQPLWDGSDAWPVDAAGVSGSGSGGAGGCGSGGLQGYDVDDPIFHSEAGFVADQVLVATFPEAAFLWLGTDRVRVSRLTDALLTATLVPQGAQWRLTEGLLAGRWPLADVFASLSWLDIGNQPLCTDIVVYGLTKDLVCSHSDVGGGGTSAPCDALSFGMAFEAHPARIGIVVAGDQAPDGCPPEVDPANDMCP